MAEKNVKVTVDLVPKDSGAIGKFTKQLGSSLSGAGGLLGGLGLPLAGAASLGGALALGRAGSPAAAAQFDQALRDTTAVFGSFLVPVLRAATDAVRALGDTALAVKQSWAGKILAEAADLPRATTELAGDALALVGVSNDLGAKWRNSMRKLGVLEGPLETTGKMFSNDPNYKRSASSVGASGFDASYSGALEYAKQQNIAALKAVGGATDPAEKTADAAQQILAILREKGADDPHSRIAALRAMSGSLNG